MKRSIIIVAGAAVSCVMFAGSAFSVPVSTDLTAKPKPRTVNVKVASVFATPSDTVECQMFRAKGASTITSIACQVWGSTVTVPPAPKPCLAKRMFWGVIELNSTGKAHYTCLPTPGVMGAAAKGARGRVKQQQWWNAKTDVLTATEKRVAPAAGSTFRGGPIVCKVNAKSVQCTNTKTTHWFDISPSKIILK